MAKATSLFPVAPCFGTGQGLRVPSGSRRSPCPRGCGAVVTRTKVLSVTSLSSKPLHFFFLVVLVFYFLPFISLKYFISLFLEGNNYLFF